MSTLKIIDTLTKLNSRIERGVLAAEEAAAKRQTVVASMVLGVLVLFILWVCGGK
jgi:hypothetical protein